MTQPLAGKVALVTGGSRGIGAAVAKRLAKEGAAVAITYSKSKKPADEVVAQITKSGGRAVAIRADAAEVEAVVKAVATTVSQLGGLDILVNNAGIGAGGTLEKTTLKDLEKLWAVNVRSVYVAIQAASKHLGQGGRIINVGSCLGERVGFPGVAPYAMTKSALRSLTQGLARELGPRGITVNNIQPGPIDTDLNPDQGKTADMLRAMTSLKRYGHVDEVASMVAYLAGPDASYVTGANLTVDGGMNA